MDFGPIEIESIPGPDYNAVARVMEEFNNETRACPCEPSCEEEVYPTSVSSATWPSKKYMVIEIKRLALKAGVNFFRTMSLIDEYLVLKMPLFADKVVF